MRCMEHVLRGFSKRQRSVNNSIKMLIGRNARRYSGKYICDVNAVGRNGLFCKPFEHLHSP
jgi:hypothetical protein